MMEEARFLGNMVIRYAIDLGMDGIPREIVTEKG